MGIFIMPQSNDEMIADFMQYRSVYHQIFVINGLYLYSKLLLSGEEVPAAYRNMLFITENEWRQCAADFVEAYEQHCAQQR